MDWNGNLRVPFVSRNDNSVSYLYNYNYHDQFSGLEIKHAPSQENQMVPSMMEKSASCSYGHDSKKKRLSNEQLECLENCFQDEIKLDPDRKMKLAKELGLQPRQIAVWFQNRRARWKGKKLEQLYDELKQEFDAVNREKHKLQQEVLALRAVLNSMAKKQISTGYIEVTGEETVESTAIPSFDKRRGTNNILHEVGDCNYPMNMDGYDQVMMNQAYWAVLPSST